ncbi:MAG: hypothetical protein QOF58_3607 [Pseudonocardiales bacterium]|jgi:hypothetical protein|nr:hypothetical protein [Pseudonocardiales bacterium]
MSKPHNNVVRLADRRAAARVKHDARARYEHTSATIELWRRGLLRSSRERARRGDVTVTAQYWNFLPQDVRVQLERMHWPEGSHFHGRSVSEWLAWNRRHTADEAAANVYGQRIRDALRSRRPARRSVADSTATVEPAARPTDSQPEQARPENGRHSMILRPMADKVIPSCACGKLRSKAMREPYAKGVYTRHVKTAEQAAAAA